MSDDMSNSGAEIAVLKQRMTALESRMKDREIGAQAIQVTLTQILVRLENLSTRVGLMAAAVGTASGFGSALAIVGIQKLLG